MTSKELRIGNWVMGNEPFQMEFDDFRLSAMYEKIRGVSRFDSIPLTEEWLLKFGFVKYDVFDDKGFEINNMILNNSYDKECDGWCFYDGNIASCNNMNFKNPIKHVHQLQNLYFALTGEELNIKNQ